tara:strand:- start:3255 stop:4100 length:846 start_codon:yes stop_codon:yes gene_type:complete
MSISSIFQEISSDNFSGDLSLFIILCILLISFRTIIVFLLRKYSLKNIFSKKIKDENNILDHFINNRINEFNNDNNKSLNEFKEKLINSCNLAVINFDIPIISIFAEIIFSIGGIFILLRIFGYKLLLFNLPAFLILSIFSRYISRKLKDLGKLILDLTEKRLNIIDNISEIAIEVSTLKYNEYLNKYFYKLNKPYNEILRKQIIYSNMLQISTESTAFIIILISLICLITNVTQTSLANSATSLAVLTRMVPSFTRTIAFITQLQFGVPCIRRLSKMINE